MSKCTETNGNSTTSDQDLVALRSSAEAVRDRAKAARLEFVAYLAEMTVLEISEEIARRSSDQAPEDT